MAAAKEKTVFVIGAGASAEFGMPTGIDLKTQITELLNIQFDLGNRQQAGDARIAAALNLHVGGYGNDYNKYLHAAWEVRDALQQALSIDNFMDSRRGNGHVELCGKLAIVQSILAAEKSSLLYSPDHPHDSSLNYSSLEGTWLYPLFQLLTEGCNVEEFAQRLTSYTFISFNYDRCIEHYFFYATLNYYNLKPEQVTEVLKSLQIIHPYGQVGSLHQQATRTPITFGSEIHAQSLLDIARNIKTFTEQLKDEAAVQAIQQAIGEAGKIIFLGFAFHPQNLELLEVKNQSSATRIIASTYGISDSDQGVIKEQIANTLRIDLGSMRFYMEKGLKCRAIFNEYWRVLSL